MAERFHDRRHAGRALAERLRQQLADGEDVLVLALPRGGVPVGYEVAHGLGAPLDVFIVRKLGVPGHEELAMGAIASGGVRVLNPHVVRQLQVGDRAIDDVTMQETIELERREQLYRGHREPVDVAGRTVVVVDDGLATGATMRAAVQALRKAGAGRLIVAVPVGAAETCAELEAEADEVLCLVTPRPFYAVGLWYDRFDQTTDEEVRDLLGRSVEPGSAHPF